MSKVNLSVSIDDAHLDDFSDVVKKIKKAGMKVEQQMESIGIVTGSIDSAKVDSLRDVEGVAHVEEQKQVQIPPPGSDVQ